MSPRYRITNPSSPVERYGKLVQIWTKIPRENGIQKRKNPVDELPYECIGDHQTYNDKINYFLKWVQSIAR